MRAQTACRRGGSGNVVGGRGRWWLKERRDDDVDERWSVWITTGLRSTAGSGLRASPPWRIYKSSHGPEKPTRASADVTHERSENRNERARFGHLVSVLGRKLPDGDASTSRRRTSGLRLRRKSRRRRTLCPSCKSPARSPPSVRTAPPRRQGNSPRRRPPPARGGQNRQTRNRACAARGGSGGEAQRRRGSGHQSGRRPTRSGQPGATAKGAAFDPPAS